MPSEVQRIRQLLERTYEGDAWHGPSVRQILTSLSPTQALQRIGDSHNAIELVWHMIAWRDFVIQRLKGDNAYELSEEDNWPSVRFLSEAEWQQAQGALDQRQHNLLAALDHLPTERLEETVAHRSYNYYVLLQGIIQHDLYHAGQIRLLTQYRLR